LIPFTTWNDYEFSIPLAVIAGKREFLNFEPWIIDRIDKLSNSFVKAILSYVENYLLRNLRSAPQTQKDNVLEKAQLTIELLNKIFYPIMSKLKREEISPRNFEMLKRIFKECCDNFPEFTANQIPDEIERET
jgi:CCR4-NOT transcription complex subunit 1